MKLLTPKPLESKIDFITRFTNDADMIKLYPQVKRRISAAHRTLSKHSKDAVIITDKKAVKEFSKTQGNVVEKAYIVESDSGNFSIIPDNNIFSILVKAVDDQIKVEGRQDICDALRALTSKGIDSTQNVDEIQTAIEEAYSVGSLDAVEPPYSPEILAKFLDVDETHYRCCKSKVADAVCRDYSIDAVQLPDGSPYDPGKSKKYRDKIAAEITEIRNFIAECSPNVGFQGELERAVMDYEGIGWAALEVIRGRDGKAKYISHIPASRIKPLKNWQGFVENVGNGKCVYYQPFGTKIVANDGTPYNPRVHGQLTMNGKKLFFNLKDKNTAKPTRNFDDAANEVIWVVKHHSNTIYYGISDIVCALRQVLANVNILNYLIQFFEHNTVPRYAILIEGGKLADSVSNLIVEYFNTHVKGKPHKTLIIPIPATRGEVHVKFEKLDADYNDEWLKETRKDNSQAIMTAHGVSPAIIGVAESANLGSGKGLSQAEIYKDRIVTPLQRTWDTVINVLFRKGLGVQMVALKHSPLDIRDQELEKNVLLGYVERGAKTINETRIEAGFGDAVKGGDRPFIMTPQGLVFVDTLTNSMSATELEEEKLKIQEKNAKVAKQQQVSGFQKLNTPVKSGRPTKRVPNEKRVRKSKPVS